MRIKNHQSPASERVFSCHSAYQGEDWATSTLRPGCLDHEKHGSLQPDGSVKPYRVPALLMTGLRLPNPATSGPVKQKP